jgi:hypothetical protein
MVCVDDNFGTWTIKSPEDLEFYFEVQKESVWKECEGCGREVKLRPSYGICNSCADRAEMGMDY